MATSLAVGFPRTRTLAVSPAMPRLILASRSPRRHQLLTDAGIDFETRYPAETAECGICSGETPPELVARLAWQKAKDVALQVDSGVVLGCDTVAEVHGQILGKPVDRRHAAEILARLRGREHHVYSGVCLWERPDNRILVEVERTKLRMDPISDRDLEAYLESEQWMGKAGAFGYQDGLEWVRVIEGSETNVVGLPMERFRAMLVRIGYPLSAGDSWRKSTEAV